MKFIKLISKHSNDELRDRLSKYSDSDKDQIAKLYDEFEYIEFVDENGFVGMFASINDYSYSDLIDFYVEKSINFSCVDLSKDVLFGNEISFSGYTSLFEDRDLLEEVKTLSEKFYEGNISLDLVLDKINEKGISSLNKFDKKILK